ncbi:hypothetical protein HXX76_003600 [Chlamydomonas incerta]|uniref:Pherophorin domain-containing protein n=1 Tax=Chlamydomonas incerta TaxID=51695 RepID=A0A835W7X4_CHLIN|nr:hypothetical protein HXX76_003600 [Chlamydomonas incerta]|eukprot:KAG2440743.1 hypothetical protein HXX76_003600 [Chlamydomonas incerta]
MSQRLVAGGGTLYASFPFCKCPATSSLYRLDPLVASASSGSYCFRLRVQAPAGCSGGCCQADLRKIEFNVNAACASRATRVSASVNGRPTQVGPAFDRPKQGPAGAAVLRLTQLGLGPADDGAELCIRLKAGSSRNKAPGCTLLQALCVPPPGMPAGVCSAALFDSSGGCCAKSNVGGNSSTSPTPSPSPKPSPTPSPTPSPSPSPTPSPPPRASPPPTPSPPPPPTPPPPPARYCTSCVSLNFSVAADLRPPWLTDQDLSHAMQLYGSPAFCRRFMDDVSSRLNSLMLSLRIFPFDPHGYNPANGVSGCSPVIRVCSRFSASAANSVQDATTMGRIAADLAAREWLPAITGSTGGGAASGEGGLADSCDPLFRAYRVTIYDWADDCYRFNVSVTCPPGPPPAP